MRSPGSVFWGAWRRAEQLKNHSGLVSNLGYRSLSCERFSLEGARVSEGDKLVRVGNPLPALVAINSLLVLHWEVAEGSGCVFSIYSTGRR